MCIAPLSVPGLATEGDVEGRHLCRKMGAVHSVLQTISTNYILSPLVTLVQDLATKGDALRLRRCHVCKQNGGRILFKFCFISKSLIIPFQGLATEGDALRLWRHVAGLLDLSPDQRRAIISAKHRFITKLAPVLEERRLLHAQIQARHGCFPLRVCFLYVCVHVRSVCGAVAHSPPGARVAGAAPAAFASGIALVLAP